MVQMPAAVVDPRAVVVHLHHAPGGRVRGAEDKSAGWILQLVWEVSEWEVHLYILQTHDVNLSTITQTMWRWRAFFFRYYGYYLAGAGGSLTWGFCVNSSHRRPTVWLSFLPKSCNYYSSSPWSFASLALSQTYRRKPPLTPVLNIATCYTCDNDGIWGPCTLGTPCSTVGSGHQVDSPVWGQTNMSNIWRNISHISE